MAVNSSGARPMSIAAAVERDSRELFALSIRAMESRDVDLRPSGLRALLVLDELGSCTLGELSEQLVLSQSATSRLVDKLVLGRLVSRRTAAGDRRQVTLCATAAGRRATASLIRRRCEAISQTMAVMSTQDRDALRTGLRAFAGATRWLTPRSQHSADSARS
jgi:DNA-binding MarR family transcriptional regulator